MLKVHSLVSAVIQRSVTSYSIGKMICLVLSALLLAALASPTFDYDALPPLRAAVKRSALESRAARLQVRSAASFRYIDVPQANGMTFYSDVHVKSSQPLLVLEDFDHLLRGIDCTASATTLRFSDHGLYDHAKTIAASLGGGILVTSHEGCADEGARSLFEVSHHGYNDDALSISFEGGAALWEDSFVSMRVEHGHTQEQHFSRILRRQDDDGYIERDNNFTALYPTGNLKNATNYYLDLSSPSLIDREFPVFGDLTGLPIAVGCKNCTVAGNLNLTTSNFTIALKRNFMSGVKENTKAMGEALFDKLIGTQQNHLSKKNATDLFEAGQVTLEMNGFSSRIELYAEPSAEDKIAYPLMQYPLVGYLLPGIGRVGIHFVPELSLRWAVAGGMRMSYGFDVEIPNTKIVIDFKNQSRSSVTGLTNATVKALPFQANITDLDVELFFTIRPRIGVGVFFGKRFKAEAGIFLDTPALNLTVSQISSNEYDTNCERRATDIALPEAEQSVLSQFPDLTHIVGDLQIGAGADVAVALDVPGRMRDLDLEIEESFVSTTSQIATACLVWRDAPTVPAQVLGSSTVPAPTATYVAASEVVAATSSVLEAAAASSRAASVAGVTGAASAMP
ncbi:Hypothetical protein D9617_11g009720 [Elsinoe fawcettii]|nr:Hypothetical protein D9617_11g009720 [Elsinoe fawcettii]